MFYTSKCRCMCGDYIVLPHIYIIDRIFQNIPESNFKIPLSETALYSYMNK